MSILIKNLEMPKNCGECPIEQLYGRDCETAKCPITKNLDSAYRVSQARMFGCPLIELPPHGRLIDADALTEVLLQRLDALDGLDRAEMAQRDGLSCAIGDVANSPTIIESEGER